MFKRIKKITAILLAGVLTCSLVACGSKAETGVTDQAGVRMQDEGQDLYFFDDQAIATASGATTSNTPEACTAVFNLMNQGRAAKGLSSLVWSTPLENAARVRATEAATKWSHTRPNGMAFWTVDSSVQYGENLAKGYTTADTAYAAWMASPTHAANIMDAEYKTVAVAIYQSGDGQWYWAEEFGY